MRRLRGDERGHEQGAVAVLVGIMIVSMLGFGALAVDVSALVQERRTLQNGADAAALAVARGCALALADCASSSAARNKADELADLNADDGLTNIEDICGNSAPLTACASPPSVPAGTKYVQVATSTDAASGPDEVPYTFARLFGLTGGTAHRRAVAAWGPIGGATVIPLTFSKCEYDQYVAGQALQNGPPFTGPRSVIKFHKSTDCAAPPSGFDFPGGFGWLKDPDEDCNLRVDASAWADDKPGNSITKTGCDPANWQLRKVLLPVFDYTNGLNGSNGRYHIVGFASLYVTGYRFVGNNGGTWGGACSPPDTCIAGYLNKFIAVGQQFGGTNFGSVIVKLVG